MKENEIEEILDKAEECFYNELITRHLRNTKQLKSIKKFRINPFLLPYLAKFSQGEVTAESLARTLIYPRALGTSATTTFGTVMQRFTSEALSAFGSTTPGIDIEYVSTRDGKKKYCQMKSGSNTINKDDVTTIHRHFDGLRNIARTNNLPIGLNDLIIGVIYGTPEELSNHYKKLTKDHHYPVFIGKEFWHDLTGDEEFYDKLISRVTGCLNNYEVNFTKELEEVVTELASSEELQKIVERVNS